MDSFETSIDVKFDLKLLGKIFDLLMENPKSVSAEMGTGATLMYAAAIVYINLLKNGVQVDEEMFAEQARRAFDAAREAAETAPVPTGGGGKA